MAADNNAISVSTSAVRLDTVTETDSRQGQSIALYNDSSTVVYVGGPSVTASGAKKGAPIAANSWGPAFDLNTDDAIYGITASGTASVIAVETGI